MSSTTDITPRPLDLNVLLDGIADGSVVLPDFQRDFVWGEDDVLALIATVMVGWPAGSLLLMRGAPTFFTTKEFQGAPPQKADIVYVVLDGQQRLTALYRAFRRAGGIIYAVHLDALGGDGPPSAETLEEALKPYAASVWEATMPLEAQARLRVVPLYALSSASDYFQWRDRVVEAAAPAHQRALSETLARAYKDFLGTVNHYDFPAVILANSLPTEAVARIFERINKGGQELSTFDLLVARSYTREWNLRDEWNRARAERPLVDAYLKRDGLPVIQGLALRTIRDIRRPAVLNVERELIQQEWEASITAMESALEFLRASGMRHPDWLPYSTLSIPLAALARDFELETSRDVLEAWLWARSFAGDYDVASSTKIASDYGMLRQALGQGQRPEFEVPTARLYGATRRQGGSLWRAFLSLLLRHDARDLFNGDPLVAAPSQARDSVAISLYPRSADRGEDAPHLRLLSQVLLRRGRRGVGQGGVLAAVLQEPVQEADLDARLVSQFLPRSGALPAIGLDPSQLFRARSEAAMTYILNEIALLVEARPPQDPV